MALFVRVLAGLCALALLIGPQTLVVSQSTGMIGVVGSTTALANLSPGQYQMALKTGIVTPGDSPQLQYSWAPAACAAADNVTQVAPARNPAAGCWLAMLPAIDVRYWGAKGDGVTDDVAAINAAIAYAHGATGCVVIPATAKGYRISGPITVLPASGSVCVTGAPAGFIDRWPNPSTVTGTYFLTTDTSCLVASGPVRWEHLDCQGNAATSTNPVQTVAFDFGASFTGASDDLRASGYVVCARQGISATNIMHIDGLICDERGQPGPNLVNNYPEYCILHATGTPGSPNGLVSGSVYDGLVCRGGQAIQQNTFTGDGTTAAFDITLNNCCTQQTLWAADDLDWTNTVAGGAAPVPLTIGADYTLWDCGAAAAGASGSSCPAVGSGGTQIFGQNITVNLTKGSTAVAITSGSTAGWPTIQSPSQLLAWTPNYTDQPTYVASVTDATDFVLSQPAIATGPASMMVVQVNVASQGSGPGSLACAQSFPPTCGHNLETRFTTPPAAGTALTAIYQQNWYSVVINEHEGSNNVFNARILSGGRVLFKHTNGYGGDVVNAAYVEIANYCMIIGQSSFQPIIGDVVNMTRNVAPPMQGGTNQNCQTWIEPTSSGNVFNWNGSPWRVVTLPGTRAFQAFGSPTAPLPVTAQAIDARFINIRCPTASQLVLQASEDGATLLAGTNYVYHVPSLTSAAATYSAVATSAATYPITGGGADPISPTTGVSGELSVFAPGIADRHPVISRVGGQLNTGAMVTAPGAGAIVGTPAALKMIRLSCGSGTGMTGTVMMRAAF